MAWILALFLSVPGATLAQECGRSATLIPDALPLREVLDVAAAEASLAAAWPGRVSYAVGRLGFGPDRTFRRALVVAEELDDEELARLEGVLADAVRPDARVGRPIHLQIASDAGIELRPVLGFAECPPALDVSGGMDEAIHRVSETLRNNVPMRVVLDLLIDRNGRVREAIVAESSGDAGLDREAVAILKRARYAPAVVEGMEARVWVQQSIVF